MDNETEYIEKYRLLLQEMKLHGIDEKLLDDFTEIILKRSKEIEDNIDLLIEDWD